VVIVPIVKKDTDRSAVDAAVGQLTAALKGAGMRVKVWLKAAVAAVLCALGREAVCARSGRCTQRNSTCLPQATDGRPTLTAAAAAATTYAYRWTATN
jgi:hypothetical protein